MATNGLCTTVALVEIGGELRRSAGSGICGAPYLGTEPSIGHRAERAVKPSPFPF